MTPVGDGSATTIVEVTPRPPTRCTPAGVNIFAVLLAIIPEASTAGGKAGH